jgi:hypothetical protein
MHYKQSNSRRINTTIKVCIIEKTSFDSTKIYWRNIEEQAEQLNNLRAKKIISVETTYPDFTTTDLNCSRVYYEYYI